MSANGGKTRILLADDHLVVRMGIASIISFEPDLEVVAEADTGEIGQLDEDIEVGQVASGRPTRNRPSGNADPLGELLLGEPGRGLALLFGWGLGALARELLQARLLGAQIGIRPLVSLIALYVGWRVWGVWGMIVFPLLFAMLQRLAERGILAVTEEDDWRNPFDPEILLAEAEKAAAEAKAAADAKAVAEAKAAASAAEAKVAQEKAALVE